MARHPVTGCLIAMLIVAFFVCGCQTTGKWSTAWKERTKPKQNFQGLDDTQEVTYWPYKSDKARKKAANPENTLEKKLAKRSEQNKSDAQVDDLIRKGDQLSKNGQLEESRQAFQEALAGSPNNSKVHHRLAIVADKQRQFATADEHYQAALRQQPRNVNLLSDYGYSLSLRGNYAQAEQLLKQALEIDPSHQMAMANMGDIYAKQNRRAEAMAMFRAGSTENQAQAYYTKLFPQDGSAPGSGPIQMSSYGRESGPAAGLVPGQSTPAAPSTDVPSPEELKKMNFDQIQTVMSRLAKEAKQRRRDSDQREQAIARNSAIDPELQAANLNRSPQPVAGNQGINPYAGQVGIGPKGEEGWGQPGGQMSADMSSRTMGSAMPPINGGQPQFANQQPMSGNPQNQYANQSNGSNLQNSFVQGQAGSMPNQQARPQGGFPIYRRGGVQYGNGQMQPGVTVEMPGATNSTPNQQWPNAMNPNPQFGGGHSNASQMATQLGMNAGPGSLFPVVTAGASDAPPVAYPNASFQNRLGGEFQQPSSYQNPQGWSERKIEQASANGGLDNGRIEGVPSIAPASPANNWSSPHAGRLNWQTENSDTPAWATEAQSAIGGAGVDPTFGRSPRGLGSVDQFDSGTPIQNRSRNEAGRPYQGAWPNANSIPLQQMLNGSPDGRSPETLEVMRAIPQWGGSSPAPAGQQTPTGASNAVNTLPQWPHSPAR